MRLIWEVKPKSCEILMFVGNRVAKSGEIMMFVCNLVVSLVRF